MGPRAIHDLSLANSQKSSLELSTQCRSSGKFKCFRDDSAPLSEYVDLSHDPRPDTAYNRLLLERVNAVSLSL